MSRSDDPQILSRFHQWRKKLGRFCYLWRNIRPPPGYRGVEICALKVPCVAVPRVIWKMVQNDQICCFRPRNDMETCQKYFYSAFWALPQLQSEYFGGKTIWIHLATMRFSLIFNGISGIFQVDFLGVGVGLIFWPQNRDFSKSTSFLDVSGWVLAV